MKAEFPLGSEKNPCKPLHHPPTIAPQQAASSASRRALDRARARCFGIAVVFVVGFSVVGLRLIQVTLLRDAPVQILRTEIEAPPPPPRLHVGRSDIQDRNGERLATMVSSPNVIAHPKKIKDAAVAARVLASHLPQKTVADIQTLLRDEKRDSVYVALNVAPGTARDIKAEGLTGIEIEPHERRFYPDGNLTAHVVGYVDEDGNGLAGVEASETEFLSQGAGPLRLTIDVRLQAILREELAKSIDKFEAVGGSAVVMDVRDGEVLGLVSLPDFDPNQPRDPAWFTDPAAKKSPLNPYRDRVTATVYEMGSVFKMFNTALALDSNKVTLDSTFDTGPLFIGGRPVKDFENMGGAASVAQIFIKSSNRGSARMERTIGAEAQRGFLGSLGLLTRAPIELPDNERPLIPSPWTEDAAMTIAYGHGLSVTQMQTAIAASAVVNGGVLHPATLIEHSDGYMPPGVQVMSSRTSGLMCDLMRAVVTGGTASQADVPGFEVGGKTGTAEKAEHGVYNKKAQLSSFIGVFPMSNPHYMVYVTVDEPKANTVRGGHATGGATAAPTVREIIKGMVALYGLPRTSQPAETPRQVVAARGSSGSAGGGLD